MGSEPQRDREHRRHADGYQKVYDLGKDILHRLNMRPGSPVRQPGIG
jgi:hypothetical protein